MWRRYCCLTSHQPRVSGIGYLSKTIDKKVFIWIYWLLAAKRQNFKSIIAYMTNAFFYHNSNVTQEKDLIIYLVGALTRATALDSMEV